MHEAEAYRKTCDIADMLRVRGYPVTDYESVDGMIVIRFGGPRAQTIHGEAGECSFESFARAYDATPPLAGGRVL